MRARVIAFLCVLGLVGRAGLAGAQPAPSAERAPPAASAPPAVTAPPAVGIDEAPDEPPEDGYDAPPPTPRRAAADAMMVRSTLTLLLVIVIGGYLFRQTGGGRGVAGGVGGAWGSYYLIWMVVPVLIAIVTAHPAVLAVVVLGVAARPWLPDPIQWLRHARRTRALEAQVRVNPANAVARRELAAIWIDKRRPARALPHLAAARAREPDDVELQLLEGQAQALAGRHAEAAASFAAIGERSPKFRYGAPWMARADALAAVGQWAEADAALARFQAVNSSSVEGHVKRARARARQGDAAGARRERAAGRALYGELPRFQRRHQRWWYARALIGW